MDRITALLDGPRARRAFVLRSLLVPPWSMHICDEAPLTIVAVTRGEAWIVQHDTSIHLIAGSIAIVRGPEHYTIADTPTTTPDIVIHRGQRCENLSGRSLELSMRLGVRTWGHALDAPTALLTGTYENHTTLGSDLLDTLPPMIVVHHESSHTIAGILADEVVLESPGQQAVLDRLLDVLVIDTLRTWYQQQSDVSPWWDAHHDPLVGAALELIHESPAAAWTISTLARTIGTSRANLARRFNDLVGEPPITYLTKWRLSVAADLLCQPSSTVSNTARSVGYGSPYAFSTAFKRRYGISPHQHRTLVLASRDIASEIGADAARAGQ
jgi:AraC-like DNA-binding protein